MTGSDRSETPSFGYWLRLKRKALDLTRAGLANRVGCSSGTIQKLEEEERRPSAQIVERLADIFEIPPGERSAFLRFARGEWGVGISEAKEGLPWTLPSSGKHPRENLPVPLTLLIGRAAEIAQVQDYLSRADIRLVTLIGPPGIGKTRLSIEVARSALPLFSDGVFFAGLAAIQDPGLIPATVAQAMGYVGARSVLPLAQLKEGIGDKLILMVLDNCEHVIEDAASFVSSLLSACSRLKILATSRESLRVPGEWLVPLPALEVPFPISQEDLQLDAEARSNFPALTLFAERARTVQPDFRLTPENIPTISAICRQLDGLPLAIELVAARIRLMPPHALLERLRGQFLLSAHGMRAVPTRQKSLKDAIDWSYRLLSEEEQRLFAYVSVYSGGFTLEAAEAMFSRAFPEKTVSDLITLLLDKSLLLRSLDSKNETHYTMLVTVQEFARQRLRDTGHEAEIRDRHLTYFLELAQQADQELRGPKQPAWLRRLDTLQDNLRSALEWTIETGGTNAALELARRLWWFWSMRSEFQEGRRWLDHVLSLPDVSRFPDSYAAVSTQLAHHTCLQLGPRAARPAIQQSLAINRAGLHPQTLANALMVFGIILTSEDDFVPAQAALEESITLFQEAQDEWGRALVLMSLGYLAYRNDDEVTAFTRYRQALAAFRNLGDPYFQSVCLYEIGNLHAKQGDWDKGLAALRESLTLSRGLGSKYESAAGLFRLAEAKERLGESAQAVRLYWSARNLYDSIGGWHPEDDTKFEEHIASCRAALDEFAFAEAMNEGRAMTTEEAIAYALEVSASS